MKYRIRHLLCLVAMLPLLSGSQVMAQSLSPRGLQVDAYELPADFSGNLITLTPITLAGDTLRFMTDTGGGVNMIRAEAAQRLGLDIAGEMAGEQGTVKLARQSAFKAEYAIPAPTLLPPAGSHLMIREEWPEVLDTEGFLGRTWFAGRIWLLDYPGETIGKVVGLDESNIPEEHRVTLGFQTTEDGRRTMHFPRITIEVEGEEIEMLLDTGATTVLSDEAIGAIPGASPRKQGTSFIVEAVFTEWRENNPGWQVIEGGDSIMDMPLIKVPEVTIAGHTVGPVWFTMRPDGSFYEYMSQWMDLRVDGALGGSALKYFRIVVDYPNASAVFEAVGPVQ